LTARQNRGLFPQSGDLLEHLLLLYPIPIVGRRDLLLRNPLAKFCFPNHDQAAGVLVRKWAQQHCVDDTEDGAVGADAQGQCDHRYNG